jgi:hypothetical protein
MAATSIYFSPNIKMNGEIISSINNGISGKKAKFD